MPKTETIIYTAAVKPFDELPPRHQLLVAALEPDDDAVTTWHEKQAAGAADSDLSALVRFILGEMHGHPGDGLHYCSNEAGVMWWAVDEGGVSLWWGANDPLDDKRVADVSYAAVIKLVREVYGISKPKRQKKAAAEPVNVDDVVSRQLARIEKHTAAAGPAVESADVPIESVLVIENEREHFDKAELKTLAADIKARGINSPLLVVPHEFGGDLYQEGSGYRLVAGERRLRAAKLAGLTVVPVRIHRDLDEPGIAVARLQENLQRVNLNPIERAKGVQALIEKHKLTQKQVGKILGCSQGQVANIIRMMKLPPAIVTAMAAGQLSATVARDSLPMWESLGERAAGIAAEAVKQLAVELEGETWHLSDLENDVRHQLGNREDCRVIHRYRCPFNITAKRRKVLDVIEVTEWLSVTFNVKEFDKLAAAAEQKQKAASKTQKSDPAQAKANAEAAGLGPAEIAKAEKEADKQKRAEQKAALVKKLHRYATQWLQLEVLAAAGRGMTPAQGLRLLLHFAAEQRGKGRTVGNAHLADCVRKSGGRVVKCNDGWPAGIRPLPSLLSVDDKQVAKLAAEWLQTAMAANPEAFDTSWPPAAVRAAASMFGITLDAWRVSEQFLQLHTIDQLLALQKEWKLSAEWVTAPKKKQVVEWLLKQDSDKKPLPAPKLLAKAVK